MKILQFVLTSQAKYIQPELRKQRDKIEANVVEKCMIYGRRMPELASHLAISGAFQVQKDYYCDLQTLCNTPAQFLLLKFRILQLIRQTN